MEIGDTAPTGSGQAGLETCATNASLRAGKTAAPITKSEPKPIQYTLPATIIPRGDGSFIITPGKPVTINTLSPMDLAIRLRKTRRTIYRWLKTGVIPERFVHYDGLRQIFIQAEAVEHLRGLFCERHA